MSKNIILDVFLRAPFENLLGVEVQQKNLQFIMKISNYFYREK